jgi:mersacidin/lichenicidin family type 2 lantibiotic
MSRRDIIRAWKDPEYRDRLSAAQRALLPDNPAGLVELSDTDLDAAAGGAPVSVGWPCPRTYYCSSHCPLPPTHNPCCFDP